MVRADAGGNRDKYCDGVREASLVQNGALSGTDGGAGCDKSYDGGVSLPLVVQLLIQLLW